MAFAFVASPWQNAQSAARTLAIGHFGSSIAWIRENKLKPKPDRNTIFAADSSPSLLRLTMLEMVYMPRQPRVSGTT